MDQLGGYSKKIFIKSHCSPSSDKDGSCLNSRLIRKIARIINRELIKKSKEKKIELKTSIENIHEQICKILYEITGCSSETCWTKVKKIMKYMGNDKEEFIQSFKPIMPKDWINDYNTWLKTDDIENCFM